MCIGSSSWCLYVCFKKMLDPFKSKRQLDNSVKEWKSRLLGFCHNDRCPVAPAWVSEVETIQTSRLCVQCVSSGLRVGPEEEGGLKSSCSTWRLLTICHLTRGTGCKLFISHRHELCEKFNRLSVISCFFLPLVISCSPFLQKNSWQIYKTKWPMPEWRQFFTLLWTAPMG